MRVCIRNLIPQIVGKDYRVATASIKRRDCRSLYALMCWNLLNSKSCRVKVENHSFYFLNIKGHIDNIPHGCVFKFIFRKGIASVYTFYNRFNLSNIVGVIGNVLRSEHREWIGSNILEVLIAC